MIYIYIYSTRKKGTCVLNADTCLYVYVCVCVYVYMCICISFVFAKVVKGNQKSLFDYNLDSEAEEGEEVWPYKVSFPASLLPYR